ncbi:TPA: nucleotidyltransferase [Candidatus Micrarchaeota archaeon]|nr:MAG: hypothetical protein AUJ65_04750 [Candidatus Micrarchaeota archaeon CG1_02_51_15]HII39388.1 nucleotidyltransferase [Candidatus Micrarchaeota archaeon]
MQTRDENLKIMRRSAKRLAGLGIVKLVFFGSRYAGVFTRESDFDILVVSKAFAGVPFLNRAAGVYRVWNEKYPLEVCFTFEEVEQLKKRPGVVREAFKAGIVV